MKEVPTSTNHLFVMSRRDSTTGRTISLRSGSDSKLSIDVLTDTTSLDVDDSFALTVGTIYQISLTFDIDNSTMNIYVDGVLYRTYSWLHNLTIDVGGWIFGYYMYNGHAMMSNVTLHRMIIPTSKMGIFVDTEPLPKYTGYFKDYGNQGSVIFDNGYRLKSVSPSIVEIDISDPHDGQSIIKSWIERGDYFVKFDKGDHEIS